MIKLYSKKLNSLEDLRREKASKKLEASTAFHSLSASGGTIGPENNIIPGIIDTTLDVITSKGAADKIFAIAMPVISLAGRKLERNVIQSVAKEFLFGYAKWKAIQLGLKVVSSFVEKKIQKKTD